MVSTFSYAQNFRYGFTGGGHLKKKKNDREKRAKQDFSWEPKEN